MCVYYCFDCCGFGVYCLLSLLYVHASLPPQMYCWHFIYCCHSTLAQHTDRQRYQDPAFFYINNIKYSVQVQKYTHIIKCFLYLENFLHFVVVAEIKRKRKRNYTSKGCVMCVSYWILYERHIVKWYSVTLSVDQWKLKRCFSFQYNGNRMLKAKNQEFFFILVQTLIIAYSGYERRWVFFCFVPSLWPLPIFVTFEKNTFF